MKGIIKLFDRISVIFVWICGGMNWILCLIIFAGVIARYAFNSPLIWVPELAQFLFGAAFMLAGAYVLLTNSHVLIDVFIKRLPYKTGKIVECFTYIFLWIFCGVLLYQGSSMAWTSVTTLETSGSYWDPPVYFAKCVVPLSALLIMLQGISNMLKLIYAAVNGHEAEI